MTSHDDRFSTTVVFPPFIIAGIGRHSAEQPERESSENKDEHVLHVSSQFSGQFVVFSM